MEMLETFLFSGYDISIMLLYILQQRVLFQVTTPTPRPSARCSTSAPPTARAVWPSTASSVPTEPSSTRTTSSATGGSTLTAPRPRLSTLSMTTLLLNEKRQPLLVSPSMGHRQQTTLLALSIDMRRPGMPEQRWT